MGTMEYCPAIENKAVLPLATTWINQEDTMLSEIRLTGKDKHCTVITHMWNLKKTKV